jgi:mannosyl-oligosaccharide alpha-1,2-mannosidase
VNFNTSTGLPLAEINIKRKTASGYRYEFFLFFLKRFCWIRWTSDSATAEVGTVQIEMRDLSRVTGDKKYEVCWI